VRTEEDRDVAASLDVAGFGWVAEPAGDTMVVSFRGELDLVVADECRVGLAEPLAGAERTIVFDLAELDFVDSTGLRLLVDMKLGVEAQSKRLLLGPVSRNVLNLFEVTGLTSWFDYAEGYEPRREACSVCDGDIVAGARRCPRCGCAL
jgi:anti-anti-sigma factor